MDYIYLIQTREFINNKKPVYKMGGTSQENFARFKQYPAGSRLILQIDCKNFRETEEILLQIFREKYIPRIDIGDEYFEGCVQTMREDIANLLVFNKRPEPPPKIYTREALFSSSCIQDIIFNYDYSGIYRLDENIWRKFDNKDMLKSLIVKYTGIQYVPKLLMDHLKETSPCAQDFRKYEFQNEYIILGYKLLRLPTFETREISKDEYVVLDGHIWPNFKYSKVSDSLFKNENMSDLNSLCKFVFLGVPCKFIILRETNLGNSLLQLCSILRKNYKQINTSTKWKSKFKQEELPDIIFLTGAKKDEAVAFLEEFGVRVIVFMNAMLIKNEYYADILYRILNYKK